jgi:hypothetical protein
MDGGMATAEYSFFGYKCRHWRPVAGVAIPSLKFVACSYALNISNTLLNLYALGVLNFDSEPE